MSGSEAQPMSSLREQMRKYLARRNIRSEVSFYSERFTNLWEALGDVQIAADASSTGTAIIYDRIPTEFARPERYPRVHFDLLFSPVVWFALKLLGRDHARDSSNAETLLLVDPSARTDSSFREQSLKVLLAPHLVVLDSSSDISRVIDVFESKASPLARWKHDALREQLLNLLTSQEPHTISNILGPVLLGGQPPRDGPLKFLHLVCQRVGIIDEPARQAASPGKRPSASSVHATKPPSWDPQCILVDDLHEEGWANFLKRTLREERFTKELIAIASPIEDRVFGSEPKQSLLDLLTESGEEPKKLRIRQGLPLCAVPSEALLFLDLRLFAGPDGKHHEVEFLRSLHSLARQAPAADITLPWRGFTAEELAAVQCWIDNPESTVDGYHTALTFLPRLIALVDPFLPIILFSSTGQRRVTEILKPFETIITEFEKPRLLAERLATTSGLAETRLRSALANARHLHRGRRVVSWLKRECCGSTSRTPASSTGESTPRPVVEIYVDETAKREEAAFGVGGIALCFPSQNAANDFNDAMVTQDMVWGVTTGRWPTSAHDERWRNASWMPKQFDSRSDADRRVFAPTAALLLKDSASCAAAFYLRVSNERIKAKDNIATTVRDLANPMMLDRVYDTLLLQALEVLIWERLPLLLGTMEYDCEVHVATRLRCKDRLDTDEQWNSLGPKFGVRMANHTKNCFYSVSYESVAPRVAQVLQEAPIDGPLPSVTSARAANLIYGSEYKGRKLPCPGWKKKSKSGPIEAMPSDDLTRIAPKPAHYLADAVLRHRPKSPPLPPKNSGSDSDWWAAGFAETADDRFLALLQSCRLSRQGQTVIALARAAQVYPNPIPPWAKERLRETLKKLSGRDFLMLCSGIEYHESGGGTRHRG